MKWFVPPELLTWDQGKLPREHSLCVSYHMECTGVLKLHGRFPIHYSLLQFPYMIASCNSVCQYTQAAYLGAWVSVLLLTVGSRASTICQLQILRVSITEGGGPWKRGIGFTRPTAHCSLCSHRCENIFAWCKLLFQLGKCQPPGHTQTAASPFHFNSNAGCWIPMQI